MKIICGILFILVLSVLVHVLYEPPLSMTAELKKRSKAAIQQPLCFVNAKDYGAHGNGIADDTKALQAAVNAAAAGQGDGNVVIPAGTYMINALKSLRLQSNTSLYMTDQTILKAIPNNADFYVVLTIANVENVNVFGGIIRGDRNEHLRPTGQWGTGIQVSGASNITVQGTVAEECWGDGFYIGTEVFTGPGTWKVLNAVPHNIRLIDVEARYNRRQGISLIAGRNIEILRPFLTHTAGHDPEAGLDIEPNRPSDIIENVTVVDAWTSNNSGAGIQLFLRHLAGSDIPASITITGHRDDASLRGLYVVGRDAIVSGRVTVNAAEWKNSQTNGLKVADHDYRSYHIDINQAHIIDANRKGIGNKVDGAAIAIVHLKGNVVGRTGGIGNVTVRAPIIEDTGQTVLTAAPFHIWDSCPIQSLVIIDPVIKGKLKDIPLYPNIKSYIHSDR